MTLLPVNVVNLICEWAADSEQEWIPFFSPKTHNLSYKVNKYNKKYIKNADTIVHNRFDIYKIKGNLELHHIKGTEFQQFKYEAIVFQYSERLFKLYIEFDSEQVPEKKDKYIYRIMLDFKGDINGAQITHNGQFIYLNGTIYSIIEDGYMNMNNYLEIMLIYNTF